MTSTISESFYPSRAKLALIFLSSIALTGTCLWILFYSASTPPIKVQVAAWVGVPLFGFASVFVLSRLVKPRPSVVLDANGVHDNASMAKGGFIPWQDIASVNVFAVRNQKMVGIGLKDNDKFLAQVGVLRRMSARANLSMGFPLIAIPESAVNIAAEELARKIAAQCAHEP